MNFQFYLEKLFNSEEYVNFKKEFSDAFLTSGFISVDKEKKGQDQFHLDFYVPSANKLFSFKLEDGVVKVPIETLEQQNFFEISDNLDFNMNEIEGMIAYEIDKQKLKKTIQKLMYSLQKKDGKNYLIATVFVSGFGLIKAVIDLDKKEIVEFENKSFMDFLKISGKKKE